MHRELIPVGQPLGVPPPLQEPTAPLPNKAPARVSDRELSPLFIPSQGDVPLNPGPAAPHPAASSRQKKAAQYFLRFLEARDRVWNQPLQEALQTGPVTVGEVMEFRPGDKTAQQRVLEEDQQRIFGAGALYDQEAWARRGRLIPKQEHPLPLVYK